MRSSSVASAEWPRVELENPGARAVTGLSWLHQTEIQLMHYAVTHERPYFAACRFLDRTEHADPPRGPRARPKISENARFEIKIWKTFKFRVSSSMLTSAPTCVQLPKGWHQALLDSQYVPPWQLSIK